MLVGIFLNINWLLNFSVTISCSHQLFVLASELFYSSYYLFCCCCLKSFSDVIVLKQWNENEHDLSYKYPYLQTEILLTANILLRRREWEKYKMEINSLLCMKEGVKLSPGSCIYCFEDTFFYSFSSSNWLFPFLRHVCFFCTETSSHQVLSANYLFLMVHMRRLCSGVIRLCYYVEQLQVFEGTWH